MLNNRAMIFVVFIHLFIFGSVGSDFCCWFNSGQPLSQIHQMIDEILRGIQKLRMAHY